MISRLDTEVGVQFLEDVSQRRWSPHSALNRKAQSVCLIIVVVRVLSENQHAHRITILLHGDMDETKRNLIARVAERDVPAHVETDIFDGPGSMVLAISSLLAVDSRFAPPPPRNPLELGTSQIGQTFLTDTPSLDGRFEGGF